MTNIKDRIDLLMSDLVLPSRSGRKLGEEIRRTSPELPILLTSGYLCTDCEESSDNRTYFLPKPYSRSDLEGKLAQIFAPSVRSVAQAG